MKRSLVGGVTGIVLFGLASSAHALVLTGDEPVIDDFTETQSVEASLGALVSDSIASPAGAIGSRQISVQSNAVMGSASELNIIGGIAEFSAGIFDSPVYTLTYGLGAALNVELPGLSFMFDVLDTDLDAGESVDFITTLTSGDGIVETATIQLSDIGTYKVPFALFTLTDFTDVDIISFTLDTNGIQGVDLAIGPIVDPLPEPATLGLFGLGLLGLGSAMRKRRA